MLVFAVSVTPLVALLTLIGVRRLLFLCLLFAYSALCIWLNTFSFPWGVALGGGVAVWVIYLCVKILIDPDLTGSQKIDALLGREYQPTQLSFEEQRYHDYCMKNNGYHH